MCTRYLSPEEADVERYWSVTPRTSWRGKEIFPRSLGPFIRGEVDGDTKSRELMIGQFGLIPFFAKTAKLPYSTNNARFEEITEKASYRQPWARGQRCIIPAVSFDEPCWETGKNVWWRFKRADGEPWGLAGLWNTWVDKGSGEIHESYTMLTLNADAHPIMKRMHKPDPKYGPDDQDKRSVVAIEHMDVDRWLFGSTDDAKVLVKLTPADMIDAKAAN